MAITPQLKANLVVRTRLKVLHFALYELLSGMGAEKVTLDVVQKGVVERKMIEEVRMVYLDANDEVVGKITLKIDWDLHRVRAEDEGGKEFKIDEGESIAGQISKINTILINHTKALRQAYKVLKIESQFVFIPDIRDNSSKNEDAKKHLGLVSSKPIKWAPQMPLGAKIEFTAGGLDELSIKIEHPSGEHG